MKKTVRVIVTAGLLAGSASAAWAADGDQPLQVVPKPKREVAKKKFEGKEQESMPFYVFNNAVFPPVKNFAMSGFSGDVEDLKTSGSYSNLHVEGYPTLKISYAARGLMGWAGVLWQNPANNWGEFDGGYNLSAAKKLTFWARGSKGGEIVDFRAGGTSANYPDSDSVSSSDIMLTDTWQQYTIDLSQADMSYISAGFGFVLKRDMNPEGCVFFLDDIRYE
jgi:hypothetical protein